jgi:hypothetical protein
MPDKFHLMPDPTTMRLGMFREIGLLNERSFSIMPGTMAGV